MQKQENSDTNSSNCTPTHLIFTRSSLIKNKKNIMTPRIFMVTEVPDVSCSKVSNYILIFEHILALVVQTYYDCDYKIDSLLKEINVLRKRLKFLMVSKKKKIKKLKNSKIEQQSIECNQIMNQLINPCKEDFEFELWSLKQIAIFECGICLFGKRFDLITSIVIQKD